MRISSYSISPNPVITNGKKSSSKDVQSFLGFVNFYWWFINGFSPHVRIDVVDRTRELEMFYLCLGFIRQFKPEAGSPILFIKQKLGLLHLCVDYRWLERNLNSLSVTPDPWASWSSLFWQTTFLSWSSRIFQVGLHQARWRMGDEKYRTLYEHFGKMVVPFSLINADDVFQHLMNDAFREILGRFLVF